MSEDVIVNVSDAHKKGFAKTLRKLYELTKDSYYNFMLNTLDYISYDSIRSMCIRRGMVYELALKGKVLYVNQQSLR